MSGLLPRTTGEDQNGTFSNLTVQTLTVNLVGFINSLVANTLSVASVIIGSITTSTINGDPGLDINASSVNVTGGAIIGDTNIITSIAQHNSINSLASDNTATINGVNPLTTNTNLTNHIAATTAHGTTSAIVGINDTQTLSNKNLVDSTTAIVDAVTPSIRILFNASGTAATSTTLTAAQTANRVLTLPDLTDTIVSRTSTDTLTNKSLSAGTTLIVDPTVATKRLQFDTSSATAATVTTLATQQTSNRIIFLPDASGTLVEESATQSLENKSLVDATTAIVNSSVASKQLKFGLGGATAGTTTTLNFFQSANNTVNFPDAAGEVVLADSFVTLTGKTLNTSVNTIEVNAAGNTDLNSLLDQDLRSSASPTFSSMTLSSATVGQTKFGGRYYEVAGTYQSVGAGTTTVHTVSGSANHCYMIEFNVIGYCSAVSAGGDLNSGFTQRSLNKAIIDNASAVTVVAAFGNQFSVGLLTGAGCSFTNSGTNLLLGISGKANDTIDWFWTAAVYYT